MSNRIWLVAALLFAGCHQSHKISARVEEIGTCLPNLLVTAVTDGKADPQTITPSLPWEKEFSSDIEGLELYVSTGVSECTQLHCQISVDGVVATEQGSARSARCKWHR